ncbi:uncharacterized protein LOC110117215 [Athalia rosae]|uniref:uncharacterized protein LOC110117215 n=1 Tax=Athalia rosae TaxID=37344 RepID=UPI002034086C|nr:uncharacterized protein LOC110117215 [Athalia rosae]
MAESNKNDNLQSDVKTRINVKIEKMKRLEERLREVEHDSRLKKNLSVIDGLQIKYSQKLESLDNAEKNHATEALNERIRGENERETRKKIISRKEKSQELRRKNLEAFENQLAEITPMFWRALTDYSKENQQKLIEERKLEQQKNLNEVENVDREMAALLSTFNQITRYGLSEAKDLKQFTAIWTKSNDARNLAIAEVEHSNEELQQKVKQAERKVANLQKSIQ